MDISVAQLLSSRICHDIVGPATSAQFSLEILRDGNEDSPETLHLANQSLESLVSRVNFLRSAFGYSSIGDGHSALTKAKNLVFALFREKDATIDWPLEYDKLLEMCANNHNIKILLNVFLILFYCAPRYCKIKLFAKEVNGSILVALSAAGSGCKLSIDNLQAISGAIELKEATAKNIQSYFTHLLCKQVNADIEARDSAKGSVQVAVLLSNVR